jgi:hypothetical protein
MKDHGYAGLVGCCSEPSWASYAGVTTRKDKASRAGYAVLHMHIDFIEIENTYAIMLHMHILVQASRLYMYNNQSVYLTFSGQHSLVHL